MRQHRVRFALEKDYQVYDVVHQYYTEEEHASLWWSREEYRETKKEAQAIVDALENNGRIVVCTRGLEKAENKTWIHPKKTGCLGFDLCSFDGTRTTIPARYP
jgi:hypothetical protein